jgi:hypothetical protein
MKQAATSQPKTVICSQHSFAVLAAFTAHLFTILTKTDDVTKTHLKFRNTPSVFTQNTCALEEIITDLHSRVLDVK